VEESLQKKINQNLLTIFKTNYHMKCLYVFQSSTLYQLKGLLTGTAGWQLHSRSGLSRWIWMLSPYKPV
jgi:hypothetical protein